MILDALNEVYAEKFSNYLFHRIMDATRAFDEEHNTYYYGMDLDDLVRFIFKNV